MSSVQLARPDATWVAPTSLFALGFFYERLQGWVRALRGDPSDDAVLGRLEILGGVDEHGDVEARLCGGVGGRAGAHGAGVL